MQAARAHPEDKSALVRIAQLYALRGERGRALEILTHVTEEHPDYATGWESLARLAIEDRQWEKAEEAVSRLHRPGGQEADTATYLTGQIKEGTGNIEEAAGIYEGIIKADPSAPIAAYALSSLLNTAKNDQQLKTVRDFLISLNSNDPALQTVLGGIEEALGDIKAAEAAYETAITGKHRNQAPYLSLAELLAKNRETTKALETLVKAEEAFPAEPDAPMLRADLLVAEGRIDEAMDVYQGILDRNDMADAAANNLAQIIADYKADDRKALERARLLAERFINSENPYYLDTLGWVYYRQGNISQAMQIAGEAMEKMKRDNPQIDFHYGAILLANGDKEKARKYLELSTSGKTYEGFSEAKNLLQSLR